MQDTEQENMSGMGITSKRNRLFEALGNMPMAWSSRQIIPHVSNPQVALQPDANSNPEHPPALEREPDPRIPDEGDSEAAPAEVAPGIAAPVEESVPLLREDVPMDISAFDGIPQVPEPNAEVMPLWPGEVGEGEPPFELTPVVSAPEAEPVEQSPKEVREDISLSEMDAVLSLFEQEAVEFAAKNITQDIPEFSLDLDSRSVPPEAQTLLLSPEFVSKDVPVFEVTPFLQSADEASGELPENIPADLSLLTLTPWAPEPPVEPVETMPQDMFIPDASRFELTPPMPWLGAEPKQLSLEIVPQDFPLFRVAQPAALAVQATSPRPPERPQDEEVPADSAQKASGSATARRVRIKVPPESRLVALTNPDSLGAEKFRAMVTRLEHLHKQTGLKSLQVTSSIVNEGKTLVSGNVALTLAKYSSARTLLIEGDLHRPTLAALFGLKNLRGLSDWWSSGDQPLSQFVQRVEGLPLWFLCAGGPCERPADILRSARFADAFAQLGAEFEWIVVDSTPMLPIVDVNLWSTLLDGTILVVREGVTPVKALKQGLRALDHPNLIGVVMNDASAVSESKYDGQYYHSSHRNHSSNRSLGGR